MERFQIRFQNVDTGFFLDGLSECSPCGKFVSAKPENSSAYQTWILECDPNGVRIRNAGDDSYLLQGLGTLVHSVVKSVHSVTEKRAIPDIREVWAIDGREIITNFDTKGVLTCNKDGSVELCGLVAFFNGDTNFHASQRWVISSTQPCYYESDEISDCNCQK